MLSYPPDPTEAARWLKREREKRGMSAGELAKRASGIANADGVAANYSQQLISLFEKGEAKKLPAWMKYVREALAAFDDENGRENHDAPVNADGYVQIQQLPTFAGMGSGGTGDGDPALMSFSKSLIETELRADPADLLAMVAEGNSMEPDFRGGDQMLVHTKKRSLAQPGAFCLWDGDGHVIKYLERIPNSDPVRVRVISANNTYSSYELLLDEINVIGRVIWFGRRVQ